LRTAAEMARHAGEPLLVSWSLTWLGNLAERAGKDQDAKRYLMEALDVSKAAGMVDSIGEAFAGLSRLMLYDNDPVRARRLADRAVAASRRSA
jgi:hypothetical protein